jgi:hypothetical protein
MHKSVWYWLNILLFALLLGGALVANIFFRTPSGYASFENRSLREFPWIYLGRTLGRRIHSIDR